MSQQNFFRTKKGIKLSSDVTEEIFSSSYHLLSPKLLDPMPSPNSHPKSWRAPSSFPKAARSYAKSKDGNGAGSDRVECLGTYL
jgi:hypothetical protein